MAITNGYLTLTEFKAAIGDQHNTDDDQVYERAIETASRQIDEVRGDQFWRTATPVARRFRPDHPWVLWTGDFATTDGLVVKIDSAEDGTFATTWDADDIQAEPLVRRQGKPYTHLTAVGDWDFPTWGLRASVEVTAIWGWPSIPAEVRQACQILAIDHYRAKDLTGGVAAFGEAGPIRVAAFNPIARVLLQELELR